jgi:predicted PhzF superfamily epimerase YddE/YHI9
MAIDEDPVTGSAHCVLAPFWAPRLRLGAGAAATTDAELERPLRARQASARGGDVWMRVDAAGTRVVVSGQGVVTVRGHALLPVE